MFLINLPLGIVQRIQLGYQEGFQNNLWSIAGSLLGLTGVLLAIELKSGLPGWFLPSQVVLPSLPLPMVYTSSMEAAVATAALDSILGK
jgi:hypothetical protein